MPETDYVKGFEIYRISKDASTISIVISKLRNLIMRGELRPSQKLIEAELCRNLQVSRPTLREALRALESEKLVELIPNRGPSVAKLGRKELEEIHEAWALVTGAIVYDFTGSRTREDIDTLSTILTEIHTQSKTGDALKQLGATNAFFAFILEKSSNSVLNEMIQGLISRINFLRAQALQSYGWGALSAEEISYIVNAIKDGDQAKAKSEVVNHISSACAAAKQVIAHHHLTKDHRLADISTNQ